MKLDKLSKGQALCRFPRGSYNKIAAIVENLNAGRGLEILRAGTKWTIRIYEPWIRGLIESIIAPEVDSASAEIVLGAHYGRTPDDETPKDFADEDDEWEIEKETVEGEEYLTEADKPLRTAGVLRFDVAASQDGPDVIHHFKWYNLRKVYDTKGNVIRVESRPAGSYDLRVEGEAEEVAPPCGNPLNDPSRGHGGGGTGDPSNPIDNPIPCGPEPGDGDDDFPPIM